jgi:hypothetical protein
VAHRPIAGSLPPIATSVDVAQHRVILRRSASRRRSTGTSFASSPPSFGRAS